MPKAQHYQGSWEQIASIARNLHGRTNLTLIVPQEEDADARTESERETARISAIRAGRGSFASEISLVDELNAERQKDKLSENGEARK